MTPAYRYLMIPADHAGDLPRRQLQPGDYVLGSAPDCDIVLMAAGLSRRHCLLSILDDGGALIRDLDSTNGTRVNGRPIRQIAQSDDFTLSVGALIFELRAVNPLQSLLAVAAAAEPQWDASQVSAETSTTLTRQVDLGSKLADCAIAQLPVSIGLGAAELQALLVAWADVLAPCRLAVREAGQPGWLAMAPLQQDQQAELVCWLREGRLELYGDALPAPVQSAVIRVFRELQRWHPLSVSAPVEIREAVLQPPGIASRNPAMRALYRSLSRVAGSRLSVMLLGETGVGKELLANWVHLCSPRRDGPLLAINCAALPHDLLEAELFGVEKGAATGVEARPGIFERAHGGTLFLDEIGDMPAETQVRVLRALEDGRVYRVGGHGLRQVDVRVVCATHADLNAAIAAGSFRADLYHRLAGYEARVPPLRERQEDIAPLALHFFHSACAEAGCGKPGVTRGALLAMHYWRWPGNVRELRQAMHRAAVLLDPGEALDLHHLPADVADIDSQAMDLRLCTAVDHAQRLAVVRALAACDGQHEAAWTALGIGKTSFYKLLKPLQCDDADSDESSG